MTVNALMLREDDIENQGWYPGDIGTDALEDWTDEVIRSAGDMDRIVRNVSVTEITIMGFVTGFARMAA